MKKISKYIADKYIISGLLLGFVLGVGLMIFFGAGLFSATITGAFCAVMCGLFGYDLSNRTYSKSWYPTIGMLGTFVGIVFGLWNLDISTASNITNSLAELLSGLKLAFLTSIFGLVLSLLRKLLDSFGIKPINEQSSIENSLKDIEKHTRQFDSKDSVIGLLQDLKVEFGKFAGKITETTSKQMSLAFGEIAADLNNKLSEQFGQNFKEFGVAVGQLVDWQKQNKEYMDYYIKRLQGYTDDYNKKLQMLAESAKDVQNIVTQTGAEIEKISVALKHIDSLSKDAKSFAPTIKGILEDTQISIQGIGNMTQTAMSDIQEIAQKSEESIHALTNEITGSIQDLSEDTLKKTDKIAADTIKQIETVAQKTISETKQAGAVVSDGINEMIKTFTNETATKLQGVVGKMDRQLGEAGGYIAGALSKLGTDIYELHNNFEDNKSRIIKLEQGTEQQIAEEKTNKKKAK